MKNVPFSAVNVRYVVIYILVVFLRILCVKVVDATSINGFLVPAVVNFTDVMSNGIKQRYYHISSLCQLATLIVNKSLTLSLPAQNLPLSQIIPTIDFLPTSGLTKRTL